MSHDKTIIGLAEPSQRILDELMETGWFTDKQDVARLCMAYAIKRGIPEGTAENVETTWGSAQFDKTGQIQSLIRALYPTNTTPVRLIEYFVNKGLEMIAERLRSGDLKASDLLD
jgi:hypothetical protein